MADFLMPSLGADMERGTVVRWLVKPGDRVTRGDVVVEIETEKAEMEVEIFETGVVTEILVPEGETVAVGTPLARLETAAAPRPIATGKDGAKVPARPRTEPVTAAPGPHATPTARLLAEQLHVDLASIAGTGVGGAITRNDVERASRETLPTSPATTAARGRVSPYARRRAADLGVDLATVHGTGRGGSVSAADVERAVTEGPTRPEAGAPPTTEPADDRTSARQRAIGALMERANREIPHYYLSTSLDLSPALQWLERENARRSVAERLLPAALLLRAVVLAARKVPEVNGHYLDGSFRPADRVDLGVAIALRDGGLLAPAIAGADSLSLAELMARLRDLVNRAREGKLRASEMASGTITVTNLGDVGVDAVHGVIYPPQVAMVGLGTPAERPWAEGGMLGIRTVVHATLSADHRVSNGHRGAVFLAAVARNIARPEQL